MAGETVLVVDDEERIVKIVAAYLQKEGFKVLTALDGPSAVQVAKSQRPRLIVLDLMLPGLSGFDVLRQVRQDYPALVIMLTARDDDTDKIIGLEIGADDYVTKPFNPKELVARVRAVLRRASTSDALPQRLAFGDLAIEIDRHEVTRAGQVVALTPTEFGLLQTLAASPGRVFTRLQLLEKVQGQAFEGYERAVDTHIKNLRQKIEPNPKQPTYVQTVFGVGYRFVAPSAPSR